MSHEAEQLQSQIEALKVELSELKDKTQQLELVVKSSGVGIWDWHVQTGKTILNERWANILGYTLEELSPVNIDTWMEHAHPDDFVESGRLLEEHWAGRTEHYIFESRMKHKDGHWIWVYDSGQVIEWEPNGAPKRMIGTHIDISERKTLELEKEALNKHLNYALDASGDGIWDWTPLNGVTVFSKAWEEMLGYEAGELPCLTSEWSDRLHPDDAEWVFAAINKIAQTAENGDTLSHEYRFRNKAGDYLWIQNKAKAVERNEQGQATRVVGTHTNITKEKEVLRKIEEVSEKAEAASKAKSEFLANMSHEIRTPMNGIYGTLHLLKGEQLSQKGRGFIKKAEYSCQNLLTIINDILDFSKIEAGHLNIENTPFNFKDVIQKVSSDMLPLAIDKDISFEVNNSLTHDKWMGDSVRVGQVMLNLLSNAIKFTEQGKVTLSLSLKQQASSHNILIEIVDTGIGMDKKTLDKLFLRFSQADDSVTRKYGGTGLGMSITQSLVHLMEGQISVDSAIDRGTTIQVMLPLEKAQSTVDDLLEAPESKLDLTGKYILIAEDNTINQAIIEAILEPFNATLNIVGNGEEAVQSAFSKRPDLILMDIQMPVKDGITACQEILAHMNDIPIIALTANVMVQDIETYLKVGFVAHLGKPFEISLLKEKLKHLLLA